MTAWEGVREWGRRPGVAVSLLLIVLGATVLIAIAEGVLRRDHDELVMQLDLRVGESARQLGAWEPARAAATFVSRLTGEGLIVAVLAGTAVLVARRRHRDAATLLAGTLSAWALTALLKLGFAVSRPTPGRPTHAITGYGFPSGHTLVTVVGCGLIAWVIGRRASLGVRLVLGTGVTVVVLLTAAARVILNAHWLSDVTGGVATGALWLGLVILGTSRTGRTPSAPS